MWLRGSISGRNQSRRSASSQKVDKKSLLIFFLGGKDFKDKVGILKLISDDIICRNRLILELERSLLMALCATTRTRLPVVFTLWPLLSDM